ncbi:AAA family ATPase, partial [Arthrobacter deserti]|nr:AAA family ATPase [Arthrobacter deserti]
TVRLKRSVLDSISDRAELAVRLRRAAELGSFSKASTASPWFGSKLLNRKETEDAHQLAVDLERDLPKLRERMATVAEHSQIALGGTFGQWGEQLDLLVAVRESLDKFTPDIFDRPVTDLIPATAPSVWRRERGIEMSSIPRFRLRRVAKEYIRPGVHIADLHESLAQVQVQRAKWGEYATTQRPPAAPRGQGVQPARRACCRPARVAGPRAGAAGKMGRVCDHPAPAGGPDRPGGSEQLPPQCPA